MNWQPYSPFVFLVVALGLRVTAVIPGEVRTEAPIAIEEAQVLLIQNTTLSAPLAGQICEVRVLEGDRVLAHDIIARLDDRRACAELTAAQAAWHAAVIQAENDVNTRYARRTFEVRERELQQSKEANERYDGSVTATEIDRPQLVIHQAELSVERSEQERKIADASAADVSSELHPVTSQVRLWATIENAEHRARSAQRW